MIDIGHRIAGRYRLVRPLAQGGMGSVWVAEDTSLGRAVAIKVMVPAAFALPELVARFHREAKAAAQIRSAHVVSIFDHGIDGDQPFIVMELLEGEDLAARLRRVGRLSLDETVRLAVEICKALKPAHERGVVHRDLKPANVFFAQQDDGEVVKVLDFGVAKLTGADAEKTQSHALLGTPYYMAPEQTHDTGTPVDLRADLWSLGVIAFRALTGQLPFPGENPVSVMMAVASRAAPAPSAVAPDLGFGPEIDRFFAIALAREPANRFQSAQAFREAIARLASRSSIVDMRASRPSDQRFSVDSGETIPLPAPTPGVVALPFGRVGPSTPPAAGLPSPSAATPSAPSASSSGGEGAGSPRASGVTQPLSDLRSTIKLDSSSAAARPLRSQGAAESSSEPAFDLAPGPPTPPGARPSATAEHTPAVMSATNAQVPARARGPNWVIWFAAGGALLTAGIVIASIVTAGRGSEDARIGASTATAAASDTGRSTSTLATSEATATSTPAPPSASQFSGSTAPATSSDPAPTATAPSAPSASSTAVTAPTGTAAPTVQATTAKPPGTVPVSTAGKPSVPPKKSDSTEIINAVPF